MRPCLALAAFLLLSALPARGEEEETADRWARLGAQAVERLHELAAFCVTTQLFAARAEVYEDVLAFDPDDAEARRWLRYERAEDGTWTRPRPYVKPKDRSRHRDSFEERRTAWRRWFEAEATPLLDAATAAGDVRLRSRILALAVHVVPDSEALRLENDEVAVEVDGRRTWILEESQRARERRPKLLQTGRDAVQEVPPPRRGPLVPEDDADAFAWGRVRVGTHVRVLGTPDTEEMGTQYRYCEACWPTVREALDLDALAWASIDAPLRGTTVYVLSSVESGNAFLRRIDGIPAGFLEFVLPMAATWVPTRRAIVVKADQPLVRLEGGPKQIIGAMEARLFGFHDERAWAGEALAHYLVHLVTGTRLLSSVARIESRYGRATEPETPDAARQMGQDSWLLRGLALVSGEGKPNLHLLAGKHLNDLTVDDVLYSYCIVAYLVEGRPETCVPFFRAVGAAQNADLEPLVVEHLGYDVATLESRVRRWLEETTGEAR